MAAKHGSSAIVELLLQNSQVDISATNFNSDTPLLIAVKQSDTAVAELILNEPMANLCEVDSNGDIPLLIAARRGDESMIDLLLEKSNSHHAEFRGSDGLTPFQTALVGGFSRIIMKLLVYGLGMVNHAVKMNHLENVHKILEIEPSLLEDRWVYLRTPLGAAAKLGNTSIVSFLVDCGANINARGFDKRMSTPVWIAASKGHLDTVRLLVERGADIELTSKGNSTNMTALLAAACNYEMDVVMYLLDAGAKVEAPAHISTWPTLKGLLGSSTLLWAAVCEGQKEAVTILAKGGVDLERKRIWSSNGLMRVKGESELVFATPIWIAASLGHTDIVRILIQHGANVEARAGFGGGITPFWRAAQQNKPEVMRVLIEGGANIRANPWVYGGINMFRLV